MHKTEKKNLQQLKQLAEDGVLALHGNSAFEQLQNYVIEALKQKHNDLVYRRHPGNDIYTVQGEVRILSEILDILLHKGK